ncbi:MAG: hypothetical protein ACREJV_14180 [Candidatus Rokuibacteriota bacterium]
MLEVADVPTRGQGASEREDEEWTFLTSDLTDTSCAVCGKELRAGQAVGHVRDQTIHARCFVRSPER